MTNTATTPSASTTNTTAKKSAGWGRGWHLRKEFTAPTGEKYSFGKLITVESK